MPRLTSDKSYQFLTMMKRHRASGLGGMPIEILQALETALHALADLLRNIWEQKRLHMNMAVGDMFVMHKKGPKEDKSNHRALRLLPHILKVLSRSLLRRVMPHMKAILPDIQAGFRP